MRVGLSYTPYYNGFKHDAQCEMLSERLGVTHISVSSLVFEEMNRRTALGLEILKCRDGGDPWPVEPMARVVAARVADPDVADGFVFDDYPHTADHAIRLDAALESLGARLDRVLRFVIPEDLIIEQALRTARTEENIRGQIRFQERNAASVFDHYGDRATRIDAVGEPDEVHARVLAALGLAVTE